jgi:hypothetical protein
MQLKASLKQRPWVKKDAEKDIFPLYPAPDMNIN